MGIYVKTASGLYPVATVRGASAEQVIDTLAEMLEDPTSHISPVLRRYFVTYSDEAGDPMPENSVFQLHINTATGDLVDFTQNLWVETSSASTLDLDFSATLWVFTGTTATWTLPTTQSPGEEYVFKNRGSGNLTVQRGGSQQFYTTTTANSITVTPGSTQKVVWDGTYWLVL